MRNKRVTDDQSAKIIAEIIENSFDHPDVRNSTTAPQLSMTPYLLLLFIEQLNCLKKGHSGQTRVRGWSSKI